MKSTRSEWWKWVYTEDERQQILAGQRSFAEFLRQTIIPRRGLLQYRSSLEKESKRLPGFIKSLESKLKNPNFVSRADPELVTKTRADHAEAIRQLEATNKALANLLGDGFPHHYANDIVETESLLKLVKESIRLFGGEDEEEGDA